jgi:hypothetical protein
MVFEPTNYISDKETINNNMITTNTYIDSNIKPKKLHPYLQAFACYDTEIELTEPLETCSDIGLCIGPGCGQHQFMLTEGHMVCQECSNVVCKTCCFSKRR